MTLRTRQITPTESRGRPSLPIALPLRGATTHAAARGRLVPGEVPCGPLDEGSGAAIARRSGAPQGSLAGLVGLLRIWLRRARERRELADLDADQMRDTGISREAARREAEKPFWRA
ncbi:MAG: hypothetical protein B7Y12_23465 [Rhizobiales bacterium 24-66-13]|nr:MAG: hypothetical protein B7Y61_16470 [Rhizobiales bacterium 35-66-30]OYZ66061.1 MAG: hypothetical protein B7Y12_23465 [Rhizobiales bacterium 24-66-13]OZA95206.1 MAG: hypothetical protein B7X67_25905 [Rhizobiales bacterium 39-66-18]HQS47529.1 DUF1127 domain-containing protein [Xanthobacteraceae bacterium]